MPSNCTRCGLPLSGTIIGDGDGRGQRFAHAECYRRRPMGIPKGVSVFWDDKTLRTTWGNHHEVGRIVSTPSPSGSWPSRSFLMKIQHPDPRYRRTEVHTLRMTDMKRARLSAISIVALRWIDQVEDLERSNPTGRIFVDHEWFKPFTQETR